MTAGPISDDCVFGFQGIAARRLSCFTHGAVKHGGGDDGDDFSEWFQVIAIVLLVVVILVIALLR